MKRGFLTYTISIMVFLFAVSLFSSFGLGVQADYSFPQVVIKPLVVVPGHDVFVSVYNGGHIVWSDTVICLRPLTLDTHSDSFCTTSPKLLPPEQFVDIPLDLPLSFLLSAEAYEVSLYYDNHLLNSRVLPLRLVMPSAGIFADDNFYVFFDPTQFNASVASLSVELSIVDAHDNLVFIDILGPFYIEGDEILMETFTLPTYLPLGDLTLQSRFFSDGSLLEESIVSFENTTSASSFPVSTIFLMFLVIVFLALAYLFLDMIYHRHDLEDTIKRLRK